MSASFVTIQSLAEYRLGRAATTGQDYAGLPMLGGCEICGATIAPYNAYPSRSGYWRCAQCIGDTGWLTVVEANQVVFGSPDGPLPLSECRVFSVVCETPGCDRQDEAVGGFRIAASDADYFVEHYRDGLATPADHCDTCGALGALREDIIPTCACAYCEDEAEALARLPLRCVPYPPNPSDDAHP